MSDRAPISLRIGLLMLCLQFLLLCAWSPGPAQAAQGAVLSVTVPDLPPSVGRKHLAPKLPASLTQAPSVPVRAGLGRSGPKIVSSDSSTDCQAALSVAPRLPSLRIDPLVGEIVLPSFLRPSERGLISFAMPPPGSRS